MAMKSFRCEDCGEVFEKIVSSLKGSLRILCPKCGSDEVKNTYWRRFLDRLGCFEGG